MDIVFFILISKENNIYHTVKRGQSIKIQDIKVGICVCRDMKDHITHDTINRQVVHAKKNWKLEVWQKTWLKTRKSLLNKNSLFSNTSMQKHILTESQKSIMVLNKKNFLHISYFPECLPSDYNLIISL